MKSFGLLLIILLHCFLLNAQKGGSAKAIADEGKRLYKCEMASGFGTSALQQRYPGKIQEIGGYFSYQEHNKMKCIIWNCANNTLEIIPKDAYVRRIKPVKKTVKSL
jgi:hypothetical protein